MKNQSIPQYLFVFAGTATLLGAVLHLITNPLGVYIFGVGSILMVASYGINAVSFKEEDLRQRRVFRIGFIASLSLLISTYLMYVNSNSWVVFLLIYALVSFYLSFRTG